MNASYQALRKIRLWLALSTILTVTSCGHAVPEHEPQNVVGVSNTNLDSNHLQPMSIGESSGVSRFTAINTLDMNRDSEIFYFSAKQLGNSIQTNDSLVVMLGKQVLKHQWVTKGGSGTVLAVQSSFTPLQQQIIHIHKLLNGRTVAKTSEQAYAELALRVGGVFDKNGKASGGAYVQMESFQLPSDHTIGNKIFKYEGFGWESELVAYRYYFDNRGATDIFGKQTPSMVLAKVGLDGTDYHALDEWGMDILKVGGSLGLGAVAGFYEGEIVKLSHFANAGVSIDNGSLFAAVNMTLDKWTVGKELHDLNVQYRIAGGSRLTEVNASTKQAMNMWATGIVNHSVAVINGDSLHPIDTESSKQDFCYRATYGAQSLNNDNLGMAIFYPCSSALQMIDSELNIGVGLQATHLNYYFMAGWEAESSVFANKQGFVAYINQLQLQLNNPINIVRAE